MASASPARTAADLFARKGEAAPLGDGEPAARTGTAGRGVPQTDLFGYIVEPAGPGTPLEPSADSEPPPAASLLSILSHASAAVVREPAPKPAPNVSQAEVYERKPADAAEGPQESVAATESESVAATVPDEAEAPAATAPPADQTGARPVSLPATVISNLPAVIPPLPAAPGRRRTARAALAAALFATAAGLAALYLGGVPAAPDRGDTGTATADRPATGAAPDTTTVGTVQTEAASPEMSIPETPEASGTPEAASTPKTEIGDVRIDDTGRATVSGTAAPGETLIVLRNAEPLGTVRADATGAWTFVAAQPMRAGQHEISVVPIQADTSVVIERPDATPLPRRRPTASPRYFVQLASLPSASDARRESAKLTRRLAGLVSPDRLGIRDATILDGRTVFRVAVSGFADRQSADALCESIRRRNEPCLVMRGR